VGEGVGEGEGDGVGDGEGVGVAAVVAVTSTGELMSSVFTHEEIPPIRAEPARKIHINLKNLL